MPSTERGGLAESAFPYIDAATQDCITDEQAQFFRDNGLLVIRNVLRGEELAAMQRETQMLVDKAVAGTDEPDYAYKTHEITGKRVPFRIEYIIDKTTAGKALLGNPFILHSVEPL
jgi:ectoine hydroxylase-related dioxygenase (phytanoyl-CoA dioxygenase family)